VRHLAKMVPAYKLPLDEGRSVTAFTQAISEGRGRTLGADSSTLDSVAFLQYTGGTTGLSKGAVLTHRNIVAATLQSEAWFSRGAVSRRRRCTRSTASPRCRCITSSR
jgi:long-chain acyl-CoA synthetase